MSEELRPCPFCGGAKICTEKSINLNYCDNCSAESNVEHWNTRPIEDALNARIAELEAANQAAVLGRIAELEKKVDQILYEIELPRKSSLSDLVYPEIKYKITSVDEPEVQE